MTCTFTLICVLVTCSFCDLDAVPTTLRTKQKSITKPDIEAHTTLKGTTENEIVEVPDKAIKERIEEKHGKELKPNLEEGSRSVIFRMRGFRSSSNIVTQIRYNGFVCGPASQNTNLSHSRIYVTEVNTHSGRVDIVIETFNHLGMRKRTGGDVIVIWAEDNASGTSIRNSSAGSVVDNMDGTYAGKLTIQMTGNYTVYAKVLSLYRTQCLRFKAMDKYGNSVYSLPIPTGIKFAFKSGNVSDVTRCAPIDFIYGYPELCNFTSLNRNVSFYCGKPSNGLNCSDYDTFNTRRYNLSAIGIQRPFDDIIFNPGWGTLKQTLNISVLLPDTSTTTLSDENREILQAAHRKQKNKPQKLRTKYDRKARGNKKLSYCFDKSKRSSWSTLPSEVYIHNGNWKHVACQTRPFTPTRIRKCLANKKLFFIGDSTVRMYVEFIGNQIGEKVNYHPFYVTLNSVRDNINITWRKHELPYQNVVRRTPNGVKSTEDQIRNIANDGTLRGKDLILGLTYNTHLQAFTPDVFRDRIKRVVKALHYLFTKKPKVTVLYKGPPVTNVKAKWFDARIALLYAEILKEEFKSLKDKVGYLDVFTISVLDNNQRLHPYGITLKHQLQQFIAYTCP